MIENDNEPNEQFSIQCTMDKHVIHNYCQATGTGPGPGIGDWGLGWGIWNGKWEWENGNGKMGMENREFPYSQSQEMTV